MKPHTVCMCFTVLRGVAICLSFLLKILDLFCNNNLELSLSGHGHISYIAYSLVHGDMKAHIVGVVSWIGCRVTTRELE